MPDEKSSPANEAGLPSAGCAGRSAAYPGVAIVPTHLEANVMPALASAWNTRQCPVSGMTFPLVDRFKTRRSRNRIVRKGVTQGLITGVGDGRSGRLVRPNGIRP